MSATPTPEAALTPEGPSPEEIAFHKLFTKAEDLVYARNYEEAKPVLEEIIKQKPDDVEAHFLMLLTLGNEEPEPSTDSEAFKYAARVVELAPKSPHADKARSYIASAHAKTLESRSEVGAETLDKTRGWEIEKGAAYDLKEDTRMFTGAADNLIKSGERRLWEMEVYPEGEEESVLLPKGTKVQILGQSEFLYSKTAWRGPIPKNRKDYDSNMFNVSAFYVAVVSDGDLSGKQGWIINQMDRWITDDPEDKHPWGVWIYNRARVLRK
ncbi:MAG: tetratricopeptide repeat protein [Candidatus Eremiobacteraeota bacterium]|nr:tetratricopeptide repeat protein [Candidatus Eremiobacteraeota bacterium]